MDVKRSNSGQSENVNIESDPEDGNGGFVGSNTGAALGMTVITGKQGSVTSRSIWGEQSSGKEQGQQAPETSFGGQDPTDEYAGYKHVQESEGLPQTFRNAKGAGDAGPSSSDEMGASNTDLNVQSHPDPTDGDSSFSAMPQTEFTHHGGGGAPLWKR